MFVSSNRSSATVWLWVLVETGQPLCAQFPSLENGIVKVRAWSVAVRVTGDDVG